MQASPLTVDFLTLSVVIFRQKGNSILGVGTSFRYSVSFTSVLEQCKPKASNCERLKSSAIGKKGAVSAQINAVSNCLFSDCVVIVLNDFHYVKFALNETVTGVINFIGIN